MNFSGFGENLSRLLFRDGLALAGAGFVAILTGGSWFLARLSLAPFAVPFALVFGLTALRARGTPRVFSAWGASTVGALGVLLSIKFAQPEVLMVVAASASAATWALGAREAAVGGRRYVALLAVLTLLTLLALRGVWNAMGSEGGCDQELRCYFP